MDHTVTLSVAHHPMSYYTNAMRNTVVIIPALDPDEGLITYCNRLIEAGLENILLVDDGSDEDHRRVFAELSDRCIVLRHAVNLGKGRALKDAFSLVIHKTLTDTVSYESRMPLEDSLAMLKDVECVVTADCDGQHASADVLAVAQKTVECGDALVLGARDFDSDNVPFKSRKGNKITRRLFKILHGLDLTDTQTGLRGIPVSLLAAFAEGKGERFEYELDMLVIAAREHIPVHEVPIETIYENANEGTHFRAVRDSISVYKILFGTFIKYLLTSLSSFVLDIIIFKLMLKVFAGAGEELRIGASTLIARVLSSIYNFLMNKIVVFLKEGEMLKSAVGYYILCVLQMCASAGLVIAVHRMIPIPETYVKIAVDSLLFILSYQIQKRIIFRR